MIFLRRIAAFALLSCLAAPIAAAQSLADRTQYLFTIHDKPVSCAEFVYLYRKNHQHKPEEFTRKNIEAYLDLFINYKLKVEEALVRGMDTTSAFKTEYQTYREELLKPYLPDARMIDSLVAITYDRLKEEVRASHILVRLGPDPSPVDTLEAYKKISDLRSQALSGADFGTLAARFSDEPGADATKGDLGFFTAMQMVFPFEQAAYLTPVGDISKPVRTQFGYHIVKVFDRQPSRGEVEVAHIMIRTQDPERDDEAKNTAFDIYDKLQKGMDWNELCLKYSEDSNSREKGGKLRPFGVGGMASAPEFQEAAFALREPGDISDPVKTEFGWHILRLEKKIPLPSFEEMKPALTQRVSRDERARISKDALRRKMRAQFGYVENPLVVEKLVRLSEQTLHGGAALDNKLKNEVLFSMQSNPYRVNDFLDYVAGTGSTQTSSSPDERVKQLFAQYADDMQLRLVEEKIKRESPDYKWLLKEYYEGILLFEIMEKEIWNKAMEDSLGQKAYFQNNKENYQADERMVGTIYSASSQAPLKELQQLLQSPDPDIAGFLSKQRIRQDSGSFEKPDRSVLSSVAWAPGMYLSQHKSVHYLVVIEKILPPGPETFEEARASVISDYQTFLEDSWISELKRKFGVKVLKKAKKRVFAELLDN